MEDTFTGDTLAAAASPTAEPAGAEQTQSTPTPDATSQAAPDDVAQSQPLSSDAAPVSPGPIPYDRHKEILENTRRSYAERFGWAESYSPEQLSALSQWGQILQSNPVYAYRLIEQQLKLAGMLPDQQGQSPQQPQEIVPELRSEDGRAAYSAQQLQEILRRHEAALEQKFEARLAPHEEQQRIAQITLESERRADALYNEAQTWPHFSGHEQEILQAMQADKRLSLEGAYRRVVVPKIRQLERQAVLAELKKKPAGVTINPQRPSAAPEPKPSDLPWTELIRRTYAAMQEQ